MEGGAGARGTALLAVAPPLPAALPAVPVRGGPVRGAVALGHRPQLLVDVQPLQTQLLHLLQGGGAGGGGGGGGGGSDSWTSSSST